MPSGDQSRARRLGRGAWCPDVQKQERGRWGSSARCRRRVLEPVRVLDCHLDLVLDPVEHAEPAGVRNQAPQVSNQLRDGPLVAEVGSGDREVKLQLK